MTIFNMDEQIAQYRNMVEKAAKYHWSRIEGRTWLAYDDLFQAGCVGLIEGLRRYDPNTGNAISTFLWPTIHGYIKKEITQNNHTLRVGNRFKRYASRIHASDDQDEAEWSAKLGVSVDEVRLMKEYLASGVQSMDYEYDENEGTTLHDIIGDVDEGYESAEIWERIEAACISELDRTIVRLRMKGHTNTEIVGMVQDVPGQKTWGRSKNMKQISETLRRLRKRMRKGEEA